MTRRKEQITEIILISVAVLGGMALALVMPNIVKLYPYLFKGGQGNRRRYYIQSRFRELVRKGYLKIDTRHHVILTPQGEQVLREFKADQWLQKQKKKRWDGKWRIVAFDIHERFRKQRDLLRMELKAAGFMQLQRSMWVTPYECADFVTLLKTDLLIGKSVLYITADAIESDYVLREYFDLLRR